MPANLRGGKGTAQNRHRKNTALQAQADGRRSRNFRKINCSHLGTFPVQPAYIGCKEACVKRLLPFLLALPVVIAFAQNTHERRYELRPDPNWPLAIELSSGDYQIVPSESDCIAVVYQENTPEEARKVEVQIASGHGQNTLKIAGPKSNFHAVIEVPRRTDLRVRMMTGDLHVGDVEGNKDIEMRAGNLELTSLRPRDYAKA